MNQGKLDLEIPAFIELQYSNFVENEKGAYCTRQLLNQSFLGSYKGKIKKSMSQCSNPDYVWTVLSSRQVPLFYIDGSDPKDSNWLRFIRWTHDPAKSNVICMQQNQQINYFTSKVIECGEELVTYLPYNNKNKIEANQKLKSGTTETMRTFLLNKNTSVSYIEPNMNKKSDEDDTNSIVSNIKAINLMKCDICFELCEKSDDLETHIKKNHINPNYSQIDEMQLVNSDDVNWSKLILVAMVNTVVKKHSFENSKSLLNTYKCIMNKPCNLIIRNQNACTNIDKYCLYRCNVCQKCFLYRNQLRRHLLKSEDSLSYQLNSNAHHLNCNKSNNKNIHSNCFDSNCENIDSDQSSDDDTFDNHSDFTNAICKRDTPVALNTEFIIDGISNKDSNMIKFECNNIDGIGSCIKSIRKKKLGKLENTSCKKNNCINYYKYAHNNINNNNNINENENEYNNNNHQKSGSEDGKTIYNAKLNDISKIARSTRNQQLEDCFRLIKHQHSERNVKRLKKKKERRKKKWRDMQWKRKIDLHYIETTTLNNFQVNIADNSCFCIDGTHEDLKSYTRECTEYLTSEIKHESDVHMFLKCFPDLYENLALEMSPFMDLNVSHKSNSYFTQCCYSPIKEENMSSIPNYNNIHQVILSADSASSMYFCKICPLEFKHLSDLVHHQRCSHHLKLVTMYDSVNTNNHEKNLNNSYINELHNDKTPTCLVPKVNITSPIGYLRCDPFSYIINLHWDNTLVKYCNICNNSYIRSVYKKHIDLCRMNSPEELNENTNTISNGKKTSIINKKGKDKERKTMCNEHFDNMDIVKKEDILKSNDDCSQIMNNDKKNHNFNLIKNTDSKLIKEMEDVTTDSEKPDEVILKKQGECIKDLNEKGKMSEKNQTVSKRRKNNTFLNMNYVLTKKRTIKSSKSAYAQENFVFFGKTVSIYRNPLDNPNATNTASQDNTKKIDQSPSKICRKKESELSWESENNNKEALTNEKKSNKQFSQSNTESLKVIKKKKKNFKEPTVK